MEHLALSSGGQRLEIKVPFICKHGYDGGPFQEYPERQGWTREELFCRRAWDSTFQCDDIYCAVHKCSCKRPHSVSENAAFLQNWLFFGLIHEFFGGLISTAPFVTQRDGSKIISTSALRVGAEVWESFREAMSEDRRVDVVLELEDTIQEAYEFFLFVSARSTMDPTILLSISLLGEFLVSRLNKLIPLSMKDYTEWRGSEDLEADVHTKYLVAAMLEFGWCPSDIQKLKLFDVSGIYLASEIGARRSNFDHAGCEETHCIQLQDYDELQYVTKHTDAACCCQPLAADSNRLLATLEGNGIPLISLNDSRLNVVPAAPGTKYVAISHVWSDGLGNPRGNSLPLCQLRKLDTWVRDLYTTDDASPVCFWMDTMACPVEPLSARKNAILKMGKTYQDAEKVLMLDSSLTSLNHRDMSHSEIAMRIYLSTWARRLWTLQEGIFAESLYIQFADGALNFDALHSEVRSALANAPEPGEPWCLLLHSDQMRGHNIQDEHSTDPYKKLVFRANSLHGRSVSRSSDEPICLATLLGIETSELLNARDAEKMKTFWSLFESYNRSLIWWEGSCLDEIGYRWAPGSLLNQRFKLPDPDFGEDAMAKRTEHGLLIKYPGIMLGKATSWLGPGIWLRDAGQNTFPFYAITVFDNPIPPGHTKLALILKTSPNTYGAASNGQPLLLVAINDTRDAVHFATILGSGLLRSNPRLPINELDEGITANAQKDLKELEDQIMMQSISVLRDEFMALRARDGSEPAPERLNELMASRVNASSFLSPTEGYHLGFDMTLLPDDQQWCVERDPSWQQPRGLHA